MSEGDAGERAPVAAALDALADSWARAWAGRGGFAACCTPDVSYEDPLAVAPLHGAAALGEYASRVRVAIPDLRVERMARRVGDQAHACLPWRAAGTHTGQLGDLPASGRAVTLHGVHYIELADGRIRRARGFFDLYGVATQLGFLPARGSLGETAVLLLGGFGLRARR